MPLLLQTQSKVRFWTVRSNLRAVAFLGWGAVPDMADVRQQHEQVGETCVLLPKVESTFADGPHQSVCHGVQEAQQLGAAVQLPPTLRGAQAHV